MQFSCEFFESLNEDVYISDMKTYDLLYVNAHLRKMLGLGSHEAYRGQNAMPCCKDWRNPVHFAPTPNCVPEHFMNGRITTRC